MTPLAKEHVRTFTATVTTADKDSATHVPANGHVYQLLDVRTSLKTMVRIK